MQPKPRSNLARLYRAIWHFAAGSRHLVVAFFALLFGAQLARLAVPYFFGAAVNALQDTRAQDVRSATTALLLMLGAGVLGWLLHGPGRVVERFAALKIRERFSDAVYAKLMRLPMGWHEAHHSGETIQRIGKANLALFAFAQHQYTYLQNLVGLFGPLIALFVISAPVGLAAVAAYAVLGAIVLRLDRTMARLINDENSAERRYSAELVDSLGNVGTVLTLRLEEATRTAMAHRLHAVFAPLRRNIVVNETKWLTIELFGQILRVALVALYAWLEWRSAGVIMVGTAVMVYQYSQQIGDVVGSFANQWQDIVRNGTDLSGADEIFDAAERRGSGGHVPDDWKEIRVDGLRFYHPNRRRAVPTLDDVTITLRRGDRIALVGESGSGKSSLMRVLSGLYEANAVRFHIDGVVHAELADLRSATTLIPQDPEIFENTVGHNVTMGVEVAEEEVHRACDLARLTPIVEGLPHGLDTPIVERGGNLSGGQKQRLALARGILAARSSSIIMLDEPTSSLDPATEAEVYGNLLAEFPEACVISSIHRLHLLPRFGTIVYMADGRILDLGTLDELVERQPRFRELWEKATAGGHTRAA
ncbi:ABC transporter ATP-binding protein [Azospirillum sp.]|uniref:ABC transporter ATP-binding protein n=1 Tax=Azospirillum sp. TaxID=34012 RepID=UPI003D7199EE